jgi:uncharacterized protein YoxC
MPESWSLVIALLLAVLVGASLPVLFQLFLTLGAARRTIRQVGPRVTEMLGALKETTDRLNRATTGLDESAQRARKLFDAAGDLGDSMQKLSRSLKPAVMLGSALGPALAVAIKTMVDRYGAGNDSGDDESQPQTTDSTRQPDGESAKETDHE